jgi:hypothetical protein
VIESEVGFVNGRSKAPVDLRKLFAKVLFDAFSRFGYAYSPGERILDIKDTNISHLFENLVLDTVGMC